MLKCGYEFPEFSVRLKISGLTTASCICSVLCLLAGIYWGMTLPIHHCRRVIKSKQTSPAFVPSQKIVNQEDIINHWICCPRNGGKLFVPQELRQSEIGPVEMWPVKVESESHTLRAVELVKD
jgi:hypothetical protein